MFSNIIGFMASEVGLFLAMAVAMAMWLGFRELAKRNSICHWIWNTSFKMAAYIPFCGWMTCFILTTDDENSKREKEYYVQKGRESFDKNLDYLDKKAQIAKDEENARQAQLMQQRIAHQELEDELRGRAYRRLGTRDVHLNQDGTKVKVGNSEYISVEEFKKKIR